MLTGLKRTPLVTKLEEQHDDDERDQQAVFANVVPEVVTDRRFGGFGARIGDH
jgi:hypothetical protein